MKQMRYRGFGTRTVSSEEFAAAGVKSKDITASQGEVVEMNDAAAAYFNEYEAADWQEISEREAARIAKEAEEGKPEPTPQVVGDVPIQPPPDEG